MTTTGSPRAGLAAFSIGVTLALCQTPARASDGKSATAAGNDAQVALAAVALNDARARSADCESPVRQVAATTLGPGSLAYDRPTLTWNRKLQEAARRHAKAMAQTRRFDHVGEDGSTVRERVDAAGYAWRVIGENLAAGHENIEDAVVDWLKSRTHCTALLDARYTEFGLARIDSNHPDDAYGTYWVLILGRPR